MHSYKPEEIYRISFNQVAQKLDLSRSKLYALMDSDATFPKPNESAKTSRQSRVFFLGHEVDDWIMKSFGRGLSDE